MDPKIVTTATTLALGMLGNAVTYAKDRMLKDHKSHTWVDG